MEIFDRMMSNGMKMKESLYGLVLEACIRNGKIELAVQLYEKLGSHFFNDNSIVFTTIIKGYLKQKDYEKALEFFAKIKDFK